MYVYEVMFSHVSMTLITTKADGGNTVYRIEEHVPAILQCNLGKINDFYNKVAIQATS